VIILCNANENISVAVDAKILVVILFLTGESVPLLGPDESRIGRDCNRQNRARQFFPESRFYGEILAEVVGGCGSLFTFNGASAPCRVGWPHN